MRKKTTFLKWPHLRYSVFLLCLFALGMLFLLPAERAKAAADPVNNTYEIENKDISSVTLQYKDWNGDWHNVTSGNHTFSNWEEIGFSLAYTIPAGAMAELDKNATITYKVQGITENNELLASSGKVYSSEGSVDYEVGTYTISTDGTITISLKDYTVDGVKQNQIEQNRKNVSPIRGTVRFTAEVSKLNKGEGSSTELKIGDITLKVPVQQSSSSGSQLNVNKSAGAINEKGEIAYTIDVYSSQRTNDSVTITDTMTGGTVLINNASDVTVKGPNGSDVSKTDFSVDNEKRGFSFKLPPMAENSHYYITYKGKINVPAEGATTIPDVNNTVKVESNDENNNKLEDETTVTTQVNPISKSGTYNGDNDTITWTIKINSLGRNLNGYIIGDDFYGQTNFKNVTMTDSYGKSQTISLPYTFDKDTTSNYTLTYTTEALRDVGSFGSTNTATLTPSGDDPTPYEAKTTAWTGEGFYPLSKKADSVTLAGYTDPQVKITWMVTLNADKGDIRPDETAGQWTYTDTLLDGQTMHFDAGFFSPNTEDNFKNGIISAFGQYWDKNKDEIKFIKTNDEITGFTITCHSVIPKGTKISFSYIAFAPPSGQKATYINQGDINTGRGKQTVWESATFNPLVQKFDALNETTTKDTTHDYYDIALSDDGKSTGTGILKWGIVLKIPYDINNSITLTEKLPPGVDLYESERVHTLTMKTPDSVEPVFEGFTKDEKNHVANNAEATATIANQNASIQATYNQAARTVTWTIPAELAQKYKNQIVYFYIAAQVDPEMIPSSDTGYNSVDFKNTVNVKIGNTDSGSATHTQKISKDDRHDALSKTCNRNNNNLEYTLDINPNGTNYLKNSETLTIQDILTYETKNGDDVLSLLPGSVELYEVSGSTETKIDTFTYTYNHQSEKNYNYNHTSTIEATVPDGKHLKLKYTYKANGEEASWFSNVTNTATLKGIVTTNEAKQYSNAFQVNNSAATAQTSATAISIYKHDADDFTKKLSGAVFKLEKYQDGDYTELGKYTTDKGQITFTHEDSTELTFNQAYRLTEITAPSGYRKNSIPYYFYIINSDTATYPENKPADFQGTGYHNYETIYRPNRTMGGATSIHVKKRWIDKDGNETDAPAGEKATFAVHQVERPFASNAKFILWGKDRTADLNESFNKLTSGGYAYGTKLNIQIINNSDWSENGADLTAYEENGTKLDFIKNHTNGKTTYTLTDYKVLGDMNWKVISDGDPAYLNAEVTVSSQGYTRFDDVYLQGVTVDAGGNWQTTVNDLPLYGIKNINGVLTDVAYAYYVEETAGPDGYLVHYSDDKQGVVEGNIVVTNQENLTDLELKKVWKNKEGQEIADKTNLPEAVFRLYRTGYSTEPGKMTLNLKSNDTAITAPTQNFSFKPEELVLDGYPQGTKITYELTYNDYEYSRVNPKLSDDSGQATDTPPPTDLGENQKKLTFSTVVGSDSSANSSYTLKLDHVNEGTKLERASIEVPKPVEAKKAFPNARRNRIALNANNNWTLRIAGATNQLGALPKSKTEMVNGKPVTTYYYYQVEESEVNGYTTTYSANNEIGVQNGTITAINKRNNTTISVKKNWLNTNGGDYTGTKPDKVTFDLYRKTSSDPATGINFTSNKDGLVPDINGKYPAGTKLKYRLTYSGASKNAVLKIDETETALTNSGGTSSSVFLFDIDVAANTNYELTVDDSWSNDWKLTLLSAEIPDTYGIDDQLIGTYETGTNYSWTSSDLTATGQITYHGEKKTGYYYYYVKEHPVDGFSASYANNDGINDGAKSGDITINNTKIDNTVINVRKEWQKEDGTPTTPPENAAISFKLIQEATKLSSSEGIHVTTSSNMSGGNFVFDGIPKDDVYAKGISLHYKITWNYEWNPPTLTATVKNDSSSTTTQPTVTKTTGKTTTYEFDTGPLNENTTVSINDAYGGWYNFNDFKGVVTAAANSESSSAEKVTSTIELGTYQISATNDWEWYSTSDSALELPTSAMVEEIIGTETAHVPVSYQYYIQEVDVPAGYEALYHVGTTAETSGKSNSIPLGNTATIVNRINSTSITANKIWNGVESDDLANQPDAYVTLHRALKANEGGNIIVGSEAQVGEVINLKDYKGDDNKHLWSYTWTALPKSGTYNGVAGTWLYWVEEEAVADHTTAYRYVLDVHIPSELMNNAQGKKDYLMANAHQSDTFTTPGAKHGINVGTFVIMNMKKTSIAVKKEWQNGNGETINPTDKQATVTLKRREKTYTAPTEKSNSSNPPAINVRMMTKSGTVQEIYHITDDQVKTAGTLDSDGNFVAKITTGLTSGNKFRFWYKFSNQSEYESQDVIQINPQNESQKHPTINLTIPKALLGETCINVDMMFNSYKDLKRIKIYSGDSATEETEIQKVQWEPGDETTVGSQILTADKEWTYTWTDLPTGNENSTAATQSTYEYWVEETPIAGYRSTYKIIDGSDEIESEDTSEPIAIQGTKTVITNKEVASSIAVKKVWKDEQGNTMTNSHSEAVQVNVYREMVDASGNVIIRKDTSDNDITKETVNYLFREKPNSGVSDNSPLTLKKEDNYTMDSKIVPPITGEYGGKTYGYQYTAKEVAIEGYDSNVTYENQATMGDNGLPTAFTMAITVTNTPKSNKFVLPSTGSMGLWIMMALGLGLMGCGAYLYKRKAGQKQNKPKDTSSGESG